MSIKKGMALSLAAIIAMAPMVAKAEELDMVPISAPVENVEGEEMVFEYSSFKGKITDVEVGENTLYLVAKNDQEEGLNALRVNVSEDVILLNDKTMDFIEKDDLVVGAEITVFYHKNTIMGLSNPPVLTPNVLVVNEAETMSTMVSKFDKEFLNAEKSLFARPSEETVIVDKDGNALTEDALADRDWIIFYDIVLLSYPGQTAPHKIIVLPENEESAGNEEAPAANEFLLENSFIKEVNGVKMIPLRLVGEKLGYEVTWNQESKAAELVKGPQWTAVTIGQDNYNFAKMIVKLGAAPVLVEEHTYVPMNFIEEILKATVETVEEGLKINF